VPFHARVRPHADRIRPYEMLYGLNLDEAMLRERFVEPYEAGRAVTSGGRSIASAAIDQVLVYETDELVEGAGSAGWDVAQRTGRDHTDQWITGPPGHADQTTIDAPGISRNPRRVMIVHGRNTAALDALRAFLQSLGLEPILWEDAIQETGEGSPHNLDAVSAALSIAQAVVVLFTAEDEARLLEQLPESSPGDHELKGQPRPNVLLEAGMALALGRERTILVRLGHIRGASDVDGLNAVSLSNAHGPRTALRRRLATANCAVNDRTDYLELGVAGDFDSAILE
jgi:predicted nucleotide-binding protein